MNVTSQEMVREKKILQGYERVRQFHFESGKIDNVKKSRKIEIILTPLIPLKAGRTIKYFGVTVISAIFLLNEEGKFVENLSVLMIKCKEGL